MICLKPLLRCLFIAVALQLGAAAIAAEPASVSLEGGAFKVTGWTPPILPPTGGWESILTVHAGRGDVPALLGAYALEAGALVFRPSYPITAGVQYRVALHVPGAPAVEKIIDGPRRDTTPVAHVVSVYPSGDVWPSNQLRLYINFSTAMSRNEVAGHLHILDETGKKLEGVDTVLLPGQELWDPTFQRLTLTFDPGRIKRGLTSNQTVGPPIEEGKTYTLVIDREWPDARGVPMTERFQKVFRGGPAERRTPDPANWTLSPPKPGTSAPLVVTFPTPMNYPLLQRMLEIDSVLGRVDGKIEIAAGETQWRFTPDLPWKAGNYRLIADARLEDRAGNRINQPFDIDVFEKVTKRIETPTVARPFTIK